MMNKAILAVILNAILISSVPVHANIKLGDNVSTGGGGMIIAIGDNAKVGGGGDNIVIGHYASIGGGGGEHSNWQ